MQKEAQTIEKNEHPLKGNLANFACSPIPSPAQKYHYELKHGTHGPYIQKRILWGFTK